MKTVGLSSEIPLTKTAIAIRILVGAAAFHAAFAHWLLASLVIVYLWTLADLARIQSARGAFYTGLLYGLAIFVPKLAFFYTLFSVAAILLWLILALWHALFLHLARFARNRFSPIAAAVAIAIIWTGLEYFRSELYPLKFSWIAPAQAFMPNILGATLGIYGAGFVLMFAAALYAHKRHPALLAAAVMILALAQMPRLETFDGPPLKVAGIQMEFPAELEVPLQLDRLLQSHPDMDLIVLSEYTFDGPLPQRLRDWCKKNRKHLIVGAKESAGETNFYNTAFVIGPDGDIVHKQVKAVPIQFFKDGLPAPAQTPWDSPWGNIGICICYDLSFTRVTDELIRQGAEALIVPTMDLVEWGRAQHELHARVAPLRAAEYNVPIFRVASSGISQIVTATGHVTASAPFPGENHFIAGEIHFASAQQSARVPVDRVVAPMCSFCAVLLAILSFFPQNFSRKSCAGWPALRYIAVR